MSRACSSGPRSAAEPRTGTGAARRSAASSSCRIGSNALDVTRAVKQEIAQLSLPPGVRIVPSYDRSELILGAIDTLKTTLLEEAIIVFLICIVFLFHVRSPWSP